MALPSSFFVSPNAFARTVKLSDGVPVELHFRQIPAVEFQRYRAATQANNERTRAESMAYLIARCLCDENGKQSITFDEAKQLTIEAAQSLFAALIDVNKLVATRDGKSTPEQDPAEENTDEENPDVLPEPQDPNA
jgi:hypothetical protein